MKKLTALLLILTMLCGALLTACNKSEEPTEAPTDAPTAAPADATEAPTDAPNDEPEAPTIYDHSYVPTDVFSNIAEAYEGKNPSTSAYSLSGAPYMLKDIYAFAGKTLTTLSLPIEATGAVNSDGCFVFTISVLTNDLSKIKGSTPNTYQLEISAEEFGLEANKTNVKKVIDIDLTEYEITLGENETVGFGAPSDTISPAWIAGNKTTDPVLSIIRNDFPSLIGFTANPVNGVGFADNALILNVEYTDTEIDIEQMLDALYDEYSGKKLTVFGDSITTYSGISNNSDYNATLGSQGPWYGEGQKDQAKIWNYENTYWGSLLRGLDMELCVNNSWSGHGVCDGTTFARCTNLHNVKGENPDVVVINFGINDTASWINSSTGQLYTLLKNKGDKTSLEVTTEWFEGVLKKAQNSNFADGKNRYTFCEGYALMMYLMTEKYKDTKFVNMTIAKNGHANFAQGDTLVPQYNECIRAISEYFGTTVAEQTVMDKTNADIYTVDGVHPNSLGHYRMYEDVIRALYTELMNK